MLTIVATFAAGMLIADTLDSQIVGRLLRSADRSTREVQRYRRAVGWLVVLLSFATAGLALMEMVGFNFALSGTAFTVIGVSAAGAIIALLVIARRYGRRGLRRRPLLEFEVTFHHLTAVVGGSKHANS